jgi:hypothetical protein
MKITKMILVVVVFGAFFFVGFYHVVIAPATKTRLLNGNSWNVPANVIICGETGIVSGRTVKLIDVREVNGVYKAIFSIDGIEMEPIAPHEEYELGDDVTFAIEYEEVPEPWIFIFKHNIIKNVGLYFYPEDTPIEIEKNELGM